MRAWRNLLRGSLGFVAILGAPGIPQAQEPSANSYWTHRRAVLLAVTWGKDFRFITATVLEDHARPMLAESLLAAAPSWPLPDWLRPPSGRAAPRAHTICVAHVTDRTEASNPTAEHLPEATRDFLSRGLFEEWMQELSSGDSLATWADFVVTGVRSIWPYPLAEDYPGFLRSPEMLERQHFGLLHASPGGNWVLDPLQGIEIDSRGRLGSDVDTGFCVYDAATGNRLYHDVSTTNWIALAAWLSDSCFVMAGFTPVDLRNGCDIPVRAPVVWVGNARSGKLTTFLGTPLSPWKERRVWDGQHRVFRRAYPKVQSEP